ncbi:hypothetical protein EDB19DRAFT_1824967 [Suillus lakei]|nr:hypothetical protein EDB19DRAFT_1824967 [Suillus lakei]
MIEKMNVIDSIWTEDMESDQDDDERMKNEEKFQNCERNFKKKLVILPLHGNTSVADAGNYTLHKLQLGNVPIINNFVLVATTKSTSCDCMFIGVKFSKCSGNALNVIIINMCLSCDLFKLGDTSMKTTESSDGLQYRKPEINFRIPDSTNNSLHIMVIKLLVNEMKKFWSEEMRWFGKVPILCEEHPHSSLTMAYSTMPH